jgi:hypothetical protein
VYALYIKLTEGKTRVLQYKTAICDIVICFKREMQRNIFKNLTLPSQNTQCTFITNGNNRRLRRNSREMLWDTRKLIAGQMALLQALQIIVSYWHIGRRSLKVTKLINISRRIKLKKNIQLTNTSRLFGIQILQAILAYIRLWIQFREQPSPKGWLFVILLYTLYNTP